MKQGGILSPYLFNFFVDDLIKLNDQCNKGAKIGRLYLSIVAYCDDFILLSPVFSHMQDSLKNVELYILKKKM